MPILSILVKHCFRVQQGVGLTNVWVMGHGSQHMYACAEFIPDFPTSEKANFRVIVTLRPCCLTRLLRKNVAQNELLPGQRFPCSIRYKCNCPWG